MLKIKKKLLQLEQKSTKVYKSKKEYYVWIKLYWEDQKGELFDTAS